MKFSQVIGQDALQRRLLAVAAEGRVPHALLLSGATGYGSLALALAFASHLLGEREEGSAEAANVNAEAMLAKFQHPDLHFVFPVIRPKGTPSERKITSDDFFREWCGLLQETVYFSFEAWLERMHADNQQAIIYAAEGDNISHKLSLKASQGGYKVCIIYLPERLHDACANKILKLLEEPAAKTVFILVSEEPQLILPTIRSRTQELLVRRIADEAIVAALIQRRALEEDTAHDVARIARGNWIKAVEYIDSESEKREFHDLFVAVMRLAYQRKLMAMKAWTDDIAAMGREKQRRFLAYVAEQVRENFAYNFAVPDIVYLTAEEAAFSKNFARFINERNVVSMQALIDRTMTAIGQNANPKMQFFDFALQTTALIRRQ